MNFQKFISVFFSSQFLIYKRYDILLLFCNIKSSNLSLSLLLQNDADYWLLSDADVSITDMWKTDCILHLNFCSSFFYLYLLFPSFGSQLDCWIPDSNRSRCWMGWSEYVACWIWNVRCLYPNATNSPI